jgi:hypothetical protein
MDLDWPLRSYMQYTITATQIRLDGSDLFDLFYIKINLEYLFFIGGSEMLLY